MGARALAGGFVHIEIAPCPQKGSSIDVVAGERARRAVTAEEPPGGLPPKRSLALRGLLSCVVECCVRVCRP